MPLDADSYHVHTDRCYILLSEGPASRRKRLLDLLHEMVHCASKDDRHGHDFTQLAHRVGLRGPMTTTPTATPELRAYLRSLNLGPWPIE